MPVVINEFEVLAPPRTEAGAAAPEKASSTPRPEQLEPCTAIKAIRVLEERALRTWAH
jgi:hypothetical protein